MTLPLALLNAIQLPAQSPHGIRKAHLTLSNRDPVANFEATEELLGYLSRLASVGAFALTVDHVGNSRFDLEIFSKANRLGAEITSQNEHPGVWRVLLQMLAHCHDMEPFDKVELVDGVAAPAGPTPADANRLALLQPYPPAFSNGGIECSVSDADPEERVSIVVSCARNVAKEEIQMVSALVDDWGSLVYVGGFTSPSVDIDAPLIDKPDLSRQGWTAFEVSIRNWVPNSGALSTLLNLLIAMKDRLLITEIEVE